jgi:phosphoribosylformylglycinamidine synthase
MVGVLEDITTKMTMYFKQENDVILLVGNQKNDIGCSEYLHKLKAVEYSPAPYFDIDEEFNTQQFIKDIISQKLVQSAHDVSEGGLIVTLLESGFTKGFGFDVTATENAIRTDAYWLGEAQGRIVVSTNPAQVAKIKQQAELNNIAITELGVVTDSTIKVNSNNWGRINEWKEKYDTAIEKML